MQNIYLIKKSKDPVWRKWKYKVSNSTKSNLRVDSKDKRNWNINYRYYQYIYIYILSHNNKKIFSIYLIDLTNQVILDILPKYGPTCRGQVVNRRHQTPQEPISHHSWWRHQMETFSALLAFCAGNSPVPGERPVRRSFDVFFDLRLNKRLNCEAGDLKRNPAHYEVTVISPKYPCGISYLGCKHDTWEFHSNKFIPVLTKKVRGQKHPWQVC